MLKFFGLTHRSTPTILPGNYLDFIIGICHPECNEGSLYKKNRTFKICPFGGKFGTYPYKLYLFIQSDTCFYLPGAEPVFVSIMGIHFFYIQGCIRITFPATA